MYIGVYQWCIYQNDLIYTPSIYTTFMNFKDMPHDPFKFSSEIFCFRSKTRGAHILEKKWVIAGSTKLRRWSKRSGDILVYLKKQMNVRKLQMLETAVTSSIGHAYSSLCFFCLSTSVSLATLRNTRIIFLQEIVLGDWSSKSLSSVTPNFSI